jgi:hypothetical protein
MNWQFDEISSRKRQILPMNTDGWEKFAVTFPPGTAEVGFAFSD